MLIPVVVVSTIVCVLLTLIVLIQNPKGGGLSATFGGFSTNLLGAQRTTDILEKGTWYLAIILIGLSLLSEFFVSSGPGAAQDQPQNFQPPTPVGAGATSPSGMPPAGSGTNTPTNFAPAGWENTAWPFGGPVTEAH